MNFKGFKDLNVANLLKNKGFSQNLSYGMSARH